ncbi:Quinolinate phosphoribosyl transferase [Flagelloscypha sp. PMI_526]|nr:Quinolinate phosphoribosyl transferase [Flagelloscypha sp. PMI_526]
MLFANIFVALAAILGVVAFEVTSPTATQGWTSSGPQTLSWKRVQSDPTSFAIVLTDGNPANNVILMDTVDATSATSTTVNPPSSGWPSGKYQVNLVKSKDDETSILAQSGQFTFASAGASGLATPSTEDRTGTTMVVQSTSANPSASSSEADPSALAAGAQNAAATHPASFTPLTDMLSTLHYEARKFAEDYRYSIYTDYGQYFFLPSMTKSYEHLLPPSWKRQIADWLAEDTPSFDYGGYVVGEDLKEAFLFGKGTEVAVLAGSPFFTEIFNQLGCSVEWNLTEGSSFQPVTHIATVKGKARHLLLGERIALNLLARCSGIATKSKRVKDLAQSYGFKGIIAGTRKTTPGFRLVEKYGMLVGGIDPHRHDLSSMIMLKDNHIWSSGSITAAIQKAREVGGFTLLLDVEVTNEAEADEAIAAGADIIMLDNMEGDNLINTARRLREKWGKERKFLFETSGNITEANLQQRAIPEIDILSTSVVHQSVQHIDFSLKIQR